MNATNHRNGMWPEYIKHFDIGIDLRDMGENLQQKQQQQKKK